MIKNAAPCSFRFCNANVLQKLSEEELDALDNLSSNIDLVVQKADKGNSVVLADRDVCANHMANIFKDNTKFVKTNI